MRPGAIQATTLGSGSRATATSHALALTTSPPIGCLLCYHIACPAVPTINSTTDDSPLGLSWFFNRQVSSTSVAAYLVWAYVTSIPTTLTIGLSATSTMAWTASAYAGVVQPGGSAFGAGGGGAASGTSIGIALANASGASKLLVQTVANNLSGSGITPVGGWTEIDDTGTATAACRVDSSWMISSASNQSGGGSGGTAVWAESICSFNIGELDDRPGSIQTYRCMPQLQRALR